MLTNNKYDKVKLLYKLSRVLWFLKEHAIKEATRDGNEQCLALYKELEKDLEKNIVKLETHCH